MQQSELSLSYAQLILESIICEVKRGEFARIDRPCANTYDFPNHCNRQSSDIQFAKPVMDVVDSHKREIVKVDVIRKPTWTLHIHIIEGSRSKEIYDNEGGNDCSRTLGSNREVNHLNHFHSKPEQANAKESCGICCKQGYNSKETVGFSRCRKVTCRENRSEDKRFDEVVRLSGEEESEAAYAYRY